MLKRLRTNKGEGYIDVVIMVLVAMILTGMGVKVYPVFVIKNDLNIFANELARVAEIEGNIGAKTASKANDLEANLGIEPRIQWSTTGNMQLNEAFSVELTLPVDIGFFEFGSFPIRLRAKATGRSEVYRK